MEQINIFDITRRFHRDNPYSMQAHSSIIHAKEYLRAKVLAVIGAKGSYGATSDEVETEMGLPHQTISARITELKRDGLIEESGEKRKTRSGRNAAVLVTREI